MANRDFFHEIAMTKHPIGTTDKEVLPLPVPDVWFLQQKTEGTLSEQPKKTFEEECIWFQEELKRLRTQYAPFLQSFVSSLDTKTQTHGLTEFDFRYMEKGEVFTQRKEEGKNWEHVTIPDYRGPAEEQGKWKGYYRCNFKVNQTTEELYAHKKRAVLYFQCVDYIAEIYVNGNFVGSHEGFFAPFSFDITDYLQAENECIILCKNDVPILGIGPVLDGDKIYAATGPGWDDPSLGWHHCPAGAGVFGKVNLEIRPEVFLEDIFLRPNIDKNSVELRVGIYNYTNEVKEGYNLDIHLKPRNYEGHEIGTFQGEIAYVGPGKNEYRYYIEVPQYRLWEPETPWLYEAQVQIGKENQVLSAREQQFGMKKFISDETSTPKGKFYFNNRPIVLRGANEMGHLQQCVMKGDFDQLVDDILIAKMCNMNYYRVTQRPVQEEIYDYFDMLGMMHQCDFPLFGFLRRPQFGEAVKQVQEMEHLVRRHVSTVMVTFINEPMCIRRTKDANDKFSKRYEVKGHRHLLRDELEAFFVAARKAVYVENPDRVIKNVEGDYDGPTAEGLADFHSYTMWYTNHGQPIGKMMRGYLPPIKEGWMTGCGEYGAEGLDNENVIREDYPKEWLQTEKDGAWYPDKIVKAQMHSVQGDWFEEQKTLEDWVRESQLHQANATRNMTDAYRRRADIISHTAIHLLIDAWPSGWMKTLVDHRRQPKRAFFAYRDSLLPFRINLYTGRNGVYRGEEFAVEAWVLNDTGYEREITIRAELYEPGKEVPLAVWEQKSHAAPAFSFCAGKIPVKAETMGDILELRGGVLDEKGTLLNREILRFPVYDKISGNKGVRAVGEQAEQVCRALEISTDGESTMVSSSVKEQEAAQMIEAAKAGKRCVWLLPQETFRLEEKGVKIQNKGCGGLFFAAVKKEWSKENLYMPFNHQKGYVDMVSAFTIETDLPGEAIAYTYDKQGFHGSKGGKKQLPFVQKCQMGEGELILVSLNLEGMVGCNPVMDQLLVKVIEG